MKRGMKVTTLRELLNTYSPGSVWEIPGVSYRGTAKQILQNADLEDYLGREIEYLPKYKTAIPAGMATATTADSIAVKVK